MVAENLGIAYLTSLAITPEDNIKAIETVAPNRQSFRLSAVTRETEILTPYKQKLWDLLIQNKKLEND